MRFTMLEQFKEICEKKIIFWRLQRNNHGQKLWIEQGKIIQWLKERKKKTTNDLQTKLKIKQHEHH
jgi:hypothetical protein